MKLKRIKAKNFLTYEELDYNFVDKPLMIQGLNLTDDKQKSNGSGKSSIQSMVEFCLTGDNSRGVRDNELVRFGCKESFLDLFIDCENRGERLHISWRVKIKGSNQLSLHISKDKENWEEVVFSNVNDGKKWIIDWVGISKNDIFNYFIINKTRFKSFFKSSNKEKVELINRFSDASIIDGIENVDKVALEEEYDILRDSILKSEGKLQLLQENLFKESNRDFEFELNQKTKEYKESNEEIEEEIEELNSNIESLKESILNSNTNISLSKESISIKLQEKSKLENDISLFKETIEPFNSELLNAQVSVNNFVKKEYLSELDEAEKEIEEIEFKIISKKEKLSENESNKNKVSKLLNEIDIKLSGKITCPSCSHEFIKDKNVSIEKLNENKSKAKTINTNLLKLEKRFNEEILALDKSLEKPKLRLIEIDDLKKSDNEDYNKLLLSVNNINTKINSKNNELKSLELKLMSLCREISSLEEKMSTKKLYVSKINQDINNINSEISNYKKDIESNLNFISSLTKGDNKSKLNEIKLDIKSLEKEKFQKEIDLKNLEDKLFKLNEWENNFKQFKMYIANLSLETMEYHCNRYLEGMGSDLKAKFEGYKVLANGTIKDEITSKVIRNDERTFGSFSGGEQGRLLFASILANRHMINMTHPYGGLQFLSIDEIFEGVDSLGLQSLVEEASKLQECIMIISHVTDENIHCENLLVVKENGISKIK